MNINNLQVQLQTAVENASAEATTDNTSATLYYLQLAKAVQALNMGQIRTIDQTTNLPSAATQEGWLYFVQNIDRLYFSDGVIWKDISPTPSSNSKVWAWGSGNLGQLGDDTTVSKSSPVSVVGGFTDWCQISASSNFSVALRTNSTAWAWGEGFAGRLGNNSIDDKSSPVSVVGGFTDWCQVSASSDHSLGLRANGTAWSWGYNYSGQLGDNTVVDKSSPISVVGGFTDWCQVSGGYHSLGIRGNGTAWAWGFNGQGQLGDNTTTNRSSPVSVVGGFTDWCQVSAASSTFSLGVRQNGTAWAWGCNGQGRLGDNTVVDKSSPVSVVGGFTNWCQISAGFQHSLGLRVNGTLWSWGYDFYGQLGDNTVVDKSSPVSVVGGFTNWCQVDSGQFHSLAVRQNGTVWAWGNNSFGKLGDNTEVQKSSPVSVVGGFTNWCQVSAGNNLSLAIQSI